MQLPVNAARLADQLFVGPALDDPAAVDDQDGVGVPDRGQPMGDDERRPVFHDTGQGLLNQPLGLRIQGRGRLVQDQDRRILEQGPGQGQPLALADGENAAALADQRVIALGKLGDEFVAFRGRRRGDDFFQGNVVEAVSDVGPDRIVEQDDLLGH